MIVDFYFVRLAIKVHHACNRLALRNILGSLLSEYLEEHWDTLIV